MREIEFRGKRIDNGEWVYGELVINKPTQTYRILEDFTLCVPAEHTEENLHKIACNIYLVRPETVGQFTGLLDKNGEKIFEGDVVQGVDMYEQNPKKFKGYVSYGNASFVIRSESIVHYRWVDYIVEAIGNIHDNEDLL